LNHAPFARAGADTHQYSTKDKPFRIWLAAFQTWVYVMPLKYLPQIKNQGITELSLQDFINNVRSSQQIRYSSLTWTGTTFPALKWEL
jgi:hypothetical protein